MVLVDQFCVYRCLSVEKVVIVWSYNHRHPNSESQANADSEPSNVSELKRQISLLNGLIQFSDDNAQSTPKESQKTMSQSWMSLSRSMVLTPPRPSSPLIHVDTSKSLRLVLPFSPRNVAAVDWQCTFQESDDDDDSESDCTSSSENSNEHDASHSPSHASFPSHGLYIYLSVCKPSPSVFVLNTTIQSLCNQFFVTNFSFLRSYHNGTLSSHEVRCLQHWWNQRLSPLECGGSLLRSFQAVAVEKDSADTSRSDAIERILEHGALPWYAFYVIKVRAGQPVVQMGKMREGYANDAQLNALFEFCASQYPFTASTMSSLWPDVALQISGKFRKAQLLCMRVGIEKRELLIVLRPAEIAQSQLQVKKSLMTAEQQSDRERPLRLEDDIMIQLRAQLQVLQPSPPVTGLPGCFPESETFWGLLVHHPTCKAIARLNFPTVDAHHLWEVLENIQMSKQTEHSERLTVRSRRGYWILRQVIAPSEDRSEWSTFANHTEPVLPLYTILLITKTKTFGTVEQFHPKALRYLNTILDWVSTQKHA
ncbi:hypothetical protein SJAG_01367 [Schizosaccharomyces japonicus yFS275]|uniref:Uncharacterized protein n=1 Tax=Schizosaccharomyces japonicus (strain yFS275 / FY16936) TaxID=402676 RepID=B6K0H4_SCHJY|nr:hypothetical protein SJAG_01367 [Schizosaccharomyces japonicus yFS275]EEB06324.1 hypothetical protein SJAG_01367 [Schizosaccharomyces japonicus yFS275]